MAARTSSFVQTGEFRQPYAIIVGDDSMAPEIMPGDIAYIQPCFIYHPFMEQNLGEDLFGVRALMRAMPWVRP